MLTRWMGLLDASYAMFQASRRGVAAFWTERRPKHAG